MAQYICARCHKTLTFKERSVGSLLCHDCDAKLHPQLRTAPPKATAAAPRPSPPNKKD